MIPKRLIFIWLGSELPEYGKHCMQAFKEVNPDFEVMFVYEPDLGNVQNEDLKACIELVNSGEYNMYKHMICRPWAMKNLANTEIGKITAISDAFRLYLLNKYGGIYLDLDTFPVKPFDDKLLKHQGFTVNHTKKRCDYFFLGFSKGCVDNNTVRYKHAYKSGQIFDFNKVHKIRLPEKVFTVLLKKKAVLVSKFMQCKLLFGESILCKKFSSEYYIDHFKLNSWKK